MAKNNRMPNLDNATPMSLVDDLGETREKISALKKLEGIYKEALKARLDDGQQTVDGDKFSALIEETTQSRLDQDKVKASLDPDVLATCYKEISFTTIRTTRRE